MARKKGVLRIATCQFSVSADIRRKVSKAFRDAAMKGILSTAADWSATAAAARALEGIDRSL